MRNKKITRRGFLGTAAGVGLGGLALPAFPVAFAAESGTVSESRLDPRHGSVQDTNNGCAEFWENWRSTSNQPPRKVIVGTVMQPFWGKYPGLENRLQLLTEMVDGLQAQSQKQYGRGPDLVVLPEMAITGEGQSIGEVADWSYPLDGPVKETFARKARQHGCYIVTALFLLEDKATKLCSNAAVLFDRQGEVAGIYRKVHPVVDLRTGPMEHGVTPGKEAPVFACDFGKLGIQICFDINFDYGWEELARKGAEIVVWPTQSPGTTTPSSRAMRNGYYIVSSTWRNNASVFDPTGKIVSQIKWTPSMGSVDSVGDRFRTENLLVQEIDLSYAILSWGPTLGNGEAFTKAFGDKAGFRYYEDDDRGIFWSNDPHMTVGQMLRSLNQTEEKEDMQRTVRHFREAGVPG
jgi:predicted amidohydrolase